MCNTTGVTYENIVMVKHITSVQQFLNFSLSLSLFLSLNIYIYMCVCVCVLLYTVPLPVLCTLMGVIWMCSWLELNFTHGFQLSLRNNCAVSFSFKKGTGNNKKKRSALIADYDVSSVSLVRLRCVWMELRLKSSSRLHDSISHTARN